MTILELLKDLEWKGYYGFICCPRCDGDRDDRKHEPNCELKAAIDRLEEEEKLTTQKEF